MKRDDEIGGVTLTVSEVQDIITDTLSGMDFGDSLPIDCQKAFNARCDPGDPGRIVIEFPLPFKVDPVGMYKDAWLEACAELRERCEAMDALVVKCHDVVRASDAYLPHSDDYNKMCELIRAVHSVACEVGHDGEY